MADFKDHYEVVICGGGPVGLLTAYGLQRMGIETCVIERLEKHKLPMYGRACTMLPRTLEMLDQYDLLTRLNQVGFVSRSAVNYDKDGNRDSRRGMRHVFDAMQGHTFVDYMLNIRLKYTEDIVKEEYERIGGIVAGGWEVVNLTIPTDHTDPENTHARPVKIEVKNANTSETRTLAGEYLVGADGSRSIVRHLSGISSTTDSTALRWVRIDGVVETDMPDSREGFATLESPTHGNVLWAALDHGRSRVGFALSREMMARYGETMTQGQAVEEAKLALRPFALEFKCVDWYTVYKSFSWYGHWIAGWYLHNADPETTKPNSVRHSVADTFVKNRIFLAGDACHSHSSGTAQGMNTGVHDAFNLAWKLAGVLKGWYRASILETYDSERRPVAQHLIQLDKIFSALISGTVPEELAVAGGLSSTDPSVLFTKALEENVQFNIGLGIRYGENTLNVATKSASVPCGWRAPDVLVHAPGARIPTRLHTVMKNVGLFWVLVFAGEPALTGQKVKALRGYIDGDGMKRVLTRRRHRRRGDGAAVVAANDSKGQGEAECDRVRLVTIIAGNKPQADEALGAARFGDAYYDHDSMAHARYGASVGSGAVVVVRPDGIVGFAAPLDCGPDLGAYFARFLT
ncbi:uncharacterized protein Z519_02102 [Cladophialophora bantiana CBS 173.52]|uniref:FAD-binding domain-containing protein n=1 Tax=Cladophialophora bantiana (strain ATCC 10958 / CBS 173.52 / CDC B-1940 / NIH 8579) TaxID=1442370 RepID=A0A0D2F387_CLAB1|nr:uncharacterized protein Z519_02102 [Cladophialophora bantiana CBS 173.52]KIW96711.1 hypothetical protein Z519_02102 [Cladophialophora bantiana CBS 173.52]